MNQATFIHDFALLGKQLEAWLRKEKTSPALSEAVQQSLENNAWFTEPTIRQSLTAIAQEMLNEQKLRQWLLPYTPVEKPMEVGVVMAGNIPLVGFHDFLCVLASGNKLVGKLSHKDAFLLPAVAQLVGAINPEWASRIRFVKELAMREVEKLIATGSDATASYFEKTVTGIPRLIRHNRRSVAILSGQETAEELTALLEDIFSYFGFGCRNVSLLRVPQDYDWTALIAILATRKELLQHVGYAHNYRYQKANYAMQGLPFIDAGTILLAENSSLQAPPAVLHYAYYSALNEVLDWVTEQQGQLQCVVQSAGDSNKFCTFGSAQHPQLYDYADGLDTMQWLTNTK